MSYIPSKVLQGLEDRATAQRVVDEFDPVRYSLTEDLSPSPEVDGIRHILSLHISAQYTHWPTAEPKEIEIARTTAVKSIARFLYNDVTGELLQIIRAIGNRKRTEALKIALDLLESLQ